MLPPPYFYALKILFQIRYILPGPCRSRKDFDRENTQQRRRIQGPDVFPLVEKKREQLVRFPDIANALTKSLAVFSD